MDLLISATIGITCGVWCYRAVLAWQEHQERKKSEHVLDSCLNNIRNELSSLDEKAKKDLEEMYKNYIQ